MRPALAAIGGLLLTMAQSVSGQTAATNGCVSFPTQILPVAMKFTIATANVTLCINACSQTATVFLAPEFGASGAVAAVLCGCGSPVNEFTEIVTNDKSMCDIKCKATFSCGGVNNDLGLLAWQMFGPMPPITPKATAATITTTTTTTATAIIPSISASLAESTQLSSTVTSVPSVPAELKPFHTTLVPTKKTIVFVANDTTMETEIIVQVWQQSGGDSPAAASPTGPVAPSNGPSSPVGGGTNVGLIIGIWIGAFAAIGGFALIYRNKRTRRNNAVESEADDGTECPPSAGLNGSAPRLIKDSKKSNVGRSVHASSKTDGFVEGGVENNRISVYSLTTGSQFQYFPPNSEDLLVGSAGQAPAKEDLKRKVLNHFATVAATDPLALPPGRFGTPTMQKEESISSAMGLNEANAVPVLGAMPSGLQDELATAAATDTIMPFTGLFGQNPSHPSHFQDPNNSRSKVYRRRVTTSNAAPPSIGRASAVKSARVSRRQFADGSESLLSHQSSVASDVYVNPTSKKRRNASSVYMNLLESTEKVPELKI
ncbi:hypothetical protein BDR26DRAFT_860176 [Obelidium mucronatum]|nr:hypothetical protein BDR26DRAFT_860176 [Obelidium mucronatum]